MQWKFQKEEHNRRDKAFKSDYQEHFSIAPDRGDSPRGIFLLNLRFTKNGLVRTPAWYRDWARTQKGKIKGEIRRITNNYPFLVTVGNQKLRIAFKWTADEFSANNALRRDESKAIFKHARETALELRRIVEQRLRSAEVAKQKDGTEGTTCYTIEFTFDDITLFFKFADNFCIEMQFNLR